MFPFFSVKREMPILFFLNCKGTVLFSVKCDLDPPFTTLLVPTLHVCFAAVFVLLGVNSRCLFEGDVCLIETSFKREFTLKMNMIYTVE